MERSNGDHTPLSISAFQMHHFGILNSFEFGYDGTFVPDEYLNGIRVDSTSEVIELEMAGLWVRGDGDDGYDVLDDEGVEQFRAMREDSGGPGPGDVQV